MADNDDPNPNPIETDSVAAQWVGGLIGTVNPGRPSPAPEMRGQIQPAGSAREMVARMSATSKVRGGPCG